MSKKQQRVSRNKPIISVIILLMIVIAVIIGVVSVLGKSDSNIKEPHGENNSTTESGDSDEIMNNGGLFVSYKNYTYYREYNDISYEKSAIGGRYNYTSNTSKNMMKIDDSGKKEVLFEDTGTGNIYIYNDRLFLQDRETVYDNSIIYSVCFDGSDRQEYLSGRILDFDITRGIMIVCDENNSICGIPIDSGEPYFITDDSFIAYNAVDGVLYTESYDPDMPMVQAILTSIHIDGSNALTLAVTSPDLYSEWTPDFGTSIQKIQAFGDYIYFSYGAHSGTAHIYQGGRIARVKKDGSDFQDLAGFEEPYTGYDFFVKEENSRICLIYEEYTYEENPDILSTMKMLDIDDNTVIDANTWAKPIGIPFLVDKSAYTYTNTNYKLLELLNESDFTSLEITGDFEYGEENYQTLTDIQNDENFVYFTYDSGIRDETLDLGWRLGYSWEKIVVYRKSLETGSIEILFQIGD